MADFEKAFKNIISFEGYNKNSDIQDSQEILLCSNCFNDEGLKIDAYSIGIRNTKTCPNCKSEIGNKLTKDIVRQLCYRFFVRGTIERFKYGGCPLVQFNEQNYKQSEIDVSPWLVKDVNLIEQAGEIGLFYYGPRFWMFGEVEPLKSLQNEHEKNKIIKRILDVYPTKNLTDKEYFYRLRKNPKTPHEILEYDTAPDEFLGKFRFDKTDLPLLYGSPELCIHECRTTVEDNLFVAKLAPTQTLKLLDLTELIEEDTTEFESLDIAIHFLFLAGEHSYSICREIASAAKEKGFDGIVYPSYFSYVRTGEIPFETVYGMSIRRIPQLKELAQSQSIPNVALFGRPILENKLKVECINKVIINRVTYDLTFGPAFHKAYSDETEITEDKK
ncbi:MAG: RES family NAD+ phosphorylase [bacterium]|nr:RES family NAD+ phosphorylase [bacterium]